MSEYCKVNSTKQLRIICTRGISFLGTLTKQTETTRLRVPLSKCFEILYSSACQRRTKRIPLQKRKINTTSRWTTRMASPKSQQVLRKQTRARGTVSLNRRKIFNAFLRLHQNCAYKTTRLQAR